MTIRTNLPHPNSELVSALVKQGRKAFVLTTEWFRALSDITRALPVTGTVEFSAATTAAVLFDVPEQTVSYNVLIEAPEDRRVWVTSKSTTGFTLNVSSSSSGVYGWAIVRR